MKKNQNQNISEVRKVRYLSLCHDNLVKQLHITLSTWALLEKDALRLLKSGYKFFTIGDVYKLQGVELTPDEIVKLQSLYAQIRNNMGSTYGRPFDGLDNDVLFRLMSMFNYHPVEFEVETIEEGVNIYRIMFKHRFARPVIKLYNKVKYPP